MKFLNHWIPSYDNVSIDRAVIERLPKNSLQSLRATTLPGDEERGTYMPASFKATTTTFRAEKVASRNQRVTVKYKDGTVRKEVKYKSLISDLEKGLCHIIDEV